MAKQVETYSIKITGSGTRKEIIAELKSIVEGLEAEKRVEILDGAEWESETLMTEIEHIGRK